MSSEREKKGNIFYEQEQGVMEEQDFSELSVTLFLRFLWGSWRGCTLG